MKQREIQAADHITWTCVQAYTSMTNGEENQEAATVEGTGGKVKVVCTPSGGAQTVRLDLPADWFADLSDQNLADEINKASTAATS
jgi:hypothetical protein